VEKLHSNVLREFGSFSEEIVVSTRTTMCLEENTGVQLNILYT